MSITGNKYAFSQENVNIAPDEHGVYALYDGDVTIYIGRASGKDVTIRSRLKSHKSGNEGPCTKGATHYKREVTSYPVSRESELIEEYDEQYGRLPRCNDRRP